MTLVYDERAISDIEIIRHWIEAENPLAAQSVVERILGSADRLGQFPHMGRKGREDGLLEWVVPRLPYIVCL